MLYCYCLWRLLSQFLLLIATVVVSQELVDENEGYVEQHQAFQDACSAFRSWLRAAMENMAASAETSGEKTAILAKIDKLKVGI